MKEAAEDALDMYLQAMSGKTIADGSREAKLDDAMARLADALQVGWYRDDHKEWGFDLQRNRLRL